jgi:hypothetical protein
MVHVIHIDRHVSVEVISATYSTVFARGPQYNPGRPGLLDGVPQENLDPSPRTAVHHLKASPKASQAGGDYPPAAKSVPRACEENKSM